MELGIYFVSVVITVVEGFSLSRARVHSPAPFAILVSHLRADAEDIVALLVVAEAEEEA